MSEDLTPKVDSPLAPDPYSEGEIASAMPYISPKFHPNMLTSQQERFVHYVLSGMPPGSAAVAVGMEPRSGSALMGREIIKKALEFFRTKNREKLDFTIEVAHQMYLDTYRLAEAKEDPVAMKNVVDSLVKLHAVAKPAAAQKVELTLTNARQAERMSDEKLLEHAGLDPTYLTPVPKKRELDEPPIEAEFTDVTDTAEEQPPSE